MLRHPERLAFVLVALAATSCVLAPIWVTRFVPLLDDPNHLSAVYIWRALDDPHSALHAFYATNILPVSYLLDYGLSYLLAHLASVELAHKLVLSLYVLGWAAAALVFCRATGRSAWLCLSAIPLAFSASWAHGYQPFNLGLSACLLGVTAFDRLFAAPSGKTFAAALTCSVACYFGHPLPMLFLLGCVPVLWVVHGLPLKAAAAAVLALAPSLWLLRWQSQTAAFPEGTWSVVLGPEFPVLDRQRWLERLRDLPEYALNPLSGPEDSDVFVWLLALLAVLWSVHVLRQLRVRPLFDGKRLRLFVLRQRAVWLALALLALYLIMPEHLNEPVYLWIARGRLAPAIGFFALLSAPVTRTARVRWLAAVVGVAACLLIGVPTARRYREFDAYMRGMARVLQACPRDAQILTVRLGDHMFPGLDVPVFRQLPSWVQVIHGGYNPSSFPRPIPFPFRELRQLPAPWWPRHDLYWAYLNPNIFGCVLFLQHLGPIPGNDFWLKSEDGPWQLFVRTGGSTLRR
ncbi:MAG TPA: hypothetical protein VJR89_29760 [Polyangiales bacterium]|nr:hypothetical protein [Polyangiales bacterium]